MRKHYPILTILAGTALAAIGTLCLFNDSFIFSTIAWIIGIFVIVSGVSTFFLWLQARRAYSAGNLLMSSLLQIGLGSLFIRNLSFGGALVSTVAGFIMMAIGGIMVTVGVLFFRTERQLRKAAEEQTSPFSDIRSTYYVNGEDDSIDEQ